MNEKGVDANYRFIAAYQEVNARIVQRQQALTLYVTLTASLLTGLIALHPGENRHALPVEWLVFAFPVTTICLAFLNYKTERAITNLRSFIASLEKIGNPHGQLPSYNTDPRWATGVNKVRRFHDYAAAVLASGANAIGIGTVLRLYPEQLSTTSPLTYGLIGLAILAVMSLLIIPRWSYKPASC